MTRIILIRIRSNLIWHSIHFLFQRSYRVAKSEYSLLPIRQIIKNENHLSILLEAGDLIEETIQKWN